MDPPVGVRIIGPVQITGISVDLEKPLEHALLIKLSVDSTHLDVFRLKQKEKSLGRHSLQKSLNLREGSILTVQIQEARRFLSCIRNKTLVRSDFSLENIWQEQEAGTPDDDSKRCQIHFDSPKGKIWLDFAAVSYRRPSDEDHGSQSVKNVLNFKREADAPKVSVDAALEKLRELSAVLDHLAWDMHFPDTVVKFLESLSQLSVIAKVVAGCADAAYNQINLQDQRHKEILVLAENMVRTVEHIQSIENIDQLKQLEEILQRFPSLMRTTADLIEALVKQGAHVDFVPTSSDKDKIDDLKSHHVIFKEQFDRGLRIDTEIQMPSFVQLQDIKKLEESLLRGVKTVDPWATECIEGTRTRILADVMTMANDLDGPNVIWIRGAPGSGKSSTSLTIKSQLHQNNRLVAYFRFDRSDSTVTTSDALWRRVAYGLAERYPSVLKHSLSLLQNNNVDLTSTMELFSSLVEEPLSKSADPPPDYPYVIVIDALDECGGYESRSSSDRKTLLRTLRRWPKLPKHFKLLVTSREEADIDQVLSYNSAAIDIPSGYSLTENPHGQASIEASNDIQTFLAHRFQQIREHFPLLPPGWPGRNTIVDMVQRAAGNFMWATAAAKFIDSEDPEVQLGSIMSQASKSVEPLYSLYSTILDASFRNLVHNSSGAEALRIILGITIFARRPLNDDEYTKIPTTKPLEKARVEFIRDRLRSVVNQGSTLRFVHKSFDDFLLSEECPPKYAINRDESQYLLSKLCLMTLKAELRFNMCNLGTSCLKNSDVPDVEIKVKNGISSLLSYSCCFWAEHVSCTRSHEEVKVEVKDMVYKKLLYWFEAMSLLKEMNRVSPSLLLVLGWLEVKSDKEFTDFLRDAHRFIGAFIRPIEQSAPHTYISALSFAPEHSLVASHFLPRFPSTLSLSTGRPMNWPPCLFTSEHHFNSVHSVVFSPDEKYFVSGSDDTTICVCDSETGNLVAGPFHGSSEVLGTFFSSDGRHACAYCDDGEVVSWDVETGNNSVYFKAGGDDLLGCCYFDGGPNIVSVSGKQGTVTLWNGSTGERIRELLKLPKAAMVSFSPDGAYVAWAGRRNMIVRIWKLADGREIKGHRLDFQGHTEPISALSFSIEGTHVVSGSDDGTILVWDATSGDVVGGRLVTGEFEVTAVAYSHRNGIIVSASGELGTVMVWNASTYQVLLGPLEGHTQQILGIALSRDGRRVLSASWDDTVKMWDLGAKGTLRVASGYRMVVTGVTFSPCGTKLASLEVERAVYTIRIRDVKTGEPLLNDIGLTLGRSNIVFSSDGFQIAVVDYGTLRVWDVGTGEPVIHQDLGEDEKDVRHHLAIRSIDQGYIVCSSLGDVHAWHMESGTLTEDLSISSPQPEVPGGQVRILALSPDGLVVLVYDEDRNPCHYLWNITTRQALDLIFPAGEDVRQVAFSPSGRFLVAGCFNPSQATVRVCNTDTGEITATRGEWKDCLAFSPDDAHIAFPHSSNSTADPTSICIWNSRTDNLVSLLCREGRIGMNALTFSSDGRKLASGSYDGQLRIWNTADLVGDSQALGATISDATRMEDGWITTENRQLLFWVPKDHREGLSWGRGVTVIDRTRISTQLDMTEFTYGEKWMECYKAAAE